MSSSCVSFKCIEDDVACTWHCVDGYALRGVEVLCGELDK